MPSENPTFSSTNPQFFKIILGETLKENKLVSLHAYLVVFLSHVKTCMVYLT